MKLNVINQYTYTLETIIQAGQTRIPITSVPIRTNPETRESRLFKSMFGYMKRSMSTIIRSFLMYKPLKFFCFIGAILFAAGFIIAARFSILFFMGYGRGHIQSLILSTALMLVGFEAIINGFQADLTAANRKLLEDIQYRVRKLDYDSDLKNKDKKSDEDK
jgi:hypothetical protein